MTKEISMATKQETVWRGTFGTEYTERCTLASVEDFSELYITRYGVSRDETAARWLADVPRTARILEVGCNVGNQLACLRRLGFTHVYGIDIQENAIELSHKSYEHLNTIVGSAFDIPFKDRFFDLVFTNNVLIHIAPSDLGKVFKEMARVCDGLIWGFEYYAPTFTEIKYRGNSDLLWKADYGALIAERHPEFVIKREEIFECLDEPGLQDKCYMLERKSK